MYLLFIIVNKSKQQRGDQVILTEADDLVAPSVESKILPKKSPSSVRKTSIKKNTKKNEVGVSSDNKGKFFTLEDVGAPNSHNIENILYSNILS